MRTPGRIAPVPPGPPGPPPAGPGASVFAGTAGFSAGAPRIGPPPVVGLGVPPGPTSPLPPNPVPTGAWAGGVGEPPTPVLPWLAPVSRSNVDMPERPAPGAI